MGDQDAYWSSVTCSSQSTVLPSSFSWMAMWVMAVVGAAPCQCFSPGANQMTSPGRISSMGPPQRWARPQPDVTMSVWPSGWVCHAVRAPGSKVTCAPTTRAGSGAVKSGSTRTVPVNYSAGPLAEGWEPAGLISIRSSLLRVVQVRRRSNCGFLRSILTTPATWTCLWGPRAALGRNDSVIREGTPSG